MTECKDIASLFYKPEWLDQVLEDCKREAIDCQNMKLLKQEGRAGVWNICRRLGCLKHGVPGQACQLFERYLRNIILAVENFNDIEMQADLLASLQPRFLLMMVCCVQLSAKMCSADTSNSASVTKLALLKIGKLHTNEEIIETEAHIFKELDYRIPMWTSVDIAGLLATELGLPQFIKKAVPMLVDVAEFYRDEVEQNVKLIAGISSTSESSGVRTLHLSAGAVAASTRLALNQPDPVPKLAGLLQLPATYIACIRDLLIRNLVTAHTTPAILKRKREH